MPQPSTFKFFVPFNRAYIDKATNKMMVEGLASTTEVDLTGEKMAESAIKSMASSNLPLPFRSEHRSDWDAVLGEITQLSATPDHQLLMKAELDADHPNAHFLFGKLQTGSQLGLSIGGQVNDWAWEDDPEIGRSIRTYKDIALQEVSVTSHPAVQSTFLAAISKSLSTKEPPMTQPTDATTAVDEQESPQAAPEAVNLEPADAEVAAPAEAQNPEAGTPEATNAEGLPLNLDQPAPADQPAAAPAVPSTPGNHATDAQVEAIENAKPEDTQASEQPAEPDHAGHQEDPPTGETQPDATPEPEATPAPSVPEETHKALQATCDDLQKSLTAATDELSAVKKHLAERSITLAEQEAAATKTNDELLATKAELETATKALTEAQTKATTEDARKAYQVTSKFGLALDLKTPSTEKDINHAFAGFFAGGSK